MKSSRPIGDKLAWQIEQHCGKPAGWLDEQRVVTDRSPAEQQFLELALRACARPMPRGRKALREQLQQMVRSTP